MTAQSLFVHLAVRHANAGLLASSLDARGGAVDGFHAVVQVVNLPAALQLAAHGLLQHASSRAQHIGLHRLAVLRRLSMVDMSRMPDRAMFRVRGMGVAESVSTSTSEASP